MKFSKQKMLDRLEREGRSDQVTKEARKLMDSLDGQPVSSASWHRVVYDHPVLSCQGKDGKYYDVNEDDCE